MLNKSRNILRLKVLEKIPRIEGVLLQINPTIWGISIWPLLKQNVPHIWRFLEETPHSAGFLCYEILRSEESTYYLG